MGFTLFCVLSLLILNTILYCGDAQDAELTFEPNLTQLFAGEFLTFKCNMSEGLDTDWHYVFSKNGQQIVSSGASNSYSVNLTADSSGGFQCTGHRKGSRNVAKQSNNVTLIVSAHKPKATLRAYGTSIPVGGTVTLTCVVEGSAGWKYKWFRRTSDSPIAEIVKNGTENSISISEEGMYWCQGRRGNPVFLTEDSDVFHAKITLSNKAFVKLQQNWTQIFSGETIAMACEIEGGGGDTDWEYEWRTTSSNTPPAHSEYRISSASVSHSGSYWCKGRRDLYSSTEWSVGFPLTVSTHKPRPSVQVSRRTIPVGGNETLTCTVEDAAEWKYYWFRRSSGLSESQLMSSVEPTGVISISQGGIYHCRGGRGSPVFFTEDSDAVTIEKRVSEQAVVILQPNWPVIFSGETIAVTCDVSGDGNTEWEYEWSKPNSDASPTSNRYRIISATVSDSGNYRCMAKQKWDMYSTTEWSHIVTLTVWSHRPKTDLSADSRSFPAGGSVILRCSVSPSPSGWKYYFYRGEKTLEPLTIQDNVLLPAGEMRVSQAGIYWCRGARGQPVYYTEYSDSVKISQTVSNRAVVTMQPNWPIAYVGDTITLKCEIQGGDTEWEYEWMTTSINELPNLNEYRIRRALQSDDGNYWCKGRLKRAPQNSTGWSIPVKLTVSHHVPEPVLTVSPLWLSPGASVTLTCEVARPSAGWRFYWYKAVPTLSEDHGYGFLSRIYFHYTNKYSYELLPGSSSGTAGGSYIVHGQTHTAGYVCRAGRGDPERYTSYSEAKFAWSGDFHSAGNLTVHPARVQHFTHDALSLNCEGNSTYWRVSRFSSGQQSYCSYWGFMTGSTCFMDSYHYMNSVYWCESGSGEFSNAVNLTADFGIILLSPVHPVTEGDSVTLGCKLSTAQQLLSNFTFYKNGKLIQSNDGEELKISQVSKSDEGFYKCQHSGNESPESWMSVTSSSSPFPARSVVGLVVGVLLIVVLPLLLLCWWKKTKGACHHRSSQSQRANQSSAAVQTVSHADHQHPVYSSLLHGDVSVYETISRRENIGNGQWTDRYGNVVAQIQLKDLQKRGRRDGPVESCDYSNVNPESPAGS